MTNAKDTQNHSWDARLQRSYDDEAHRYDAKRYLSPEGRLFSRLELRVLHERLQAHAGMKILDVPAGTGRLSIGLAEKGADVVAGDISRNMLRAAASKAEEDHAAGVRFTQMNVAQLPFQDDTFDAVISFKFFHLIPNEVKPNLIREMVRVLKPGGKLVAEFNSPYYGGVLAFFRYYFRKRHPGDMRTKCLFPDQVAPLFEGLRIVQKQGIKIPFAGTLASLLGDGPVDSLNLWFGRLPCLRYLSYAIIIEAEKPLSSTR